MDGADYLSQLGVPQEVVSLVAFHTGARFEAEVRGLAAQLDRYADPDQAGLDVPTMIDLATGPDGRPLLDVDRIAEILRRYEDSDPVYHSVTNARPSLLESSARGKRLLGLPDDWPVSC